MIISFILKLKNIGVIHEKSVSFYRPTSLFELRWGHTSPFLFTKKRLQYHLWPATRSLNDNEGEVWRCRAVSSSPRNYIKNFYKLS
jgi:hypothetical protein